MTLPRQEAARYVTPLREGGSLPAVVESASGELWVMKFRGAGQGPRALVAEIVVAGLAKALDLPMPELVLMWLDDAFGRTERDPEIQELLRASHGINIAMRYLDGAFNLDPVAVPEAVDEEFATRLVWLDALVINPDRTPRNPNLLFWDGRTWLIDHGAALFDHHDWSRVDEARTRRPFVSIRDHVLLHRAGDLQAADERLASLITARQLAEAVAAIPDELLSDPDRPDPAIRGPEEARARYIGYLEARLRSPRAFATEAERARRTALAEPVRRLESRR